MGYRDDLIGRLKDAGDWEKATLEQRERIERIDDDVARRYMTLLDGLESPDGYFDDEDTNLLAMIFMYSALEGAIKPFDGKLIERGIDGKHRPSDLGHALLEFVAMAKDEGFATEAEIVKELSSLTWEGLSALEKLENQP